MKKTLLSLLSFFLLCSVVSATGVGEYLKTMPNNVCPVAQTAVPDIVTEDYLHVTLSKVSELETRILIGEDGDSLLCVSQTFRAPLAESDVRIYDTQWNERQSLSFTLKDVIGQENAVRYHTYFSPLLISARLSPDSPNLELSLSCPNLSEDEKKEIKGVEMQTSLKWDGKTFK